MDLEPDRALSPNPRASARRAVSRPPASVIDGGHINSGFPDTEHSKWRILASQETKIGLFEGMFPENILTFYPPDVRSIQRDLKASGIPLLKEADESTQGAESIILEDPDGNRILLDQQS